MQHQVKRCLATHSNHMWSEHPNDDRSILILVFVLSHSLKKPQAECEVQVLMVANGQVNQLIKIEGVFFNMGS